MHSDKDQIYIRHDYNQSEQDLPTTSHIDSRPVDTPHQRALRQKTKKRQQKSLFYLGPIAEDWAIACQRAHPAGYLLACAIRTRSTLRSVEPVTVGQTLSDHLGISRDGRKRALAALEAAGLIQVERKPGRAPRVSLLPWKAKRPLRRAILSACRQK